jgi:hypothetical protein
MLSIDTSMLGFHDVNEKSKKTGQRVLFHPQRY